MSIIKVAVMGACGKMGRFISTGVVNDPELELVAAFDVINEGMNLGALIGISNIDVTIDTDLTKMLNEKKIDVIIDFTNAKALMKNISEIIEKKISVVIGTTGLNEDDINKINQLAMNNSSGVFLAPNFAIGAVLMMKYAQDAAKYFPHVEIIELHHNQKLDAPSGTAIKTLEQIAKVRRPFTQGAEDEFEKIEGSRGGDYEGIRIHSVRLPGYVAHQEVIFGGLGQTLTLRHDSISRESFIPGVMLAVKKVRTWQGLVYGLENILE
ncbi:dihydrodipicolinate reductase [Desulfonispora thiosulfatigenes DSM 11270]|uniref:4-hydroxy-tetrahydrodipicolinate reductase n=1 Tax=Desulfonispora thiosulfatigenes DSM 11270 TaxID=656914 RepID=A0A1W1VMC5_DESTI|nr:4-hydroxy-tetrahydrodipicolinate reductase [Desulfonispora thiosulfatigenes]SMB94507.1 dihydrodipicolinate reductase [Desulfonispora thiosulfatigenes DSM 11270]